MKKSIRNMLAMMLAVCLLMGSVSAFALTGKNVTLSNFSFDVMGLKGEVGAAISVTAGQDEEDGVVSLQVNGVEAQPAAQLDVIAEGGKGIIWLHGLSIAITATQEQLMEMAEQSGAMPEGAMSTVPSEEDLGKAADLANAYADMMKEITDPEASKAIEAKMETVMEGIMSRGTTGEPEDVLVLGESMKLSKHTFTMTQDDYVAIFKAMEESSPGFKRYMELMLETASVEEGGEEFKVSSFSELIEKTGMNMDVDMVLWTSEDKTATRAEVVYKVNVPASEGEEAQTIEMPATIEAIEREGDMRMVMSMNSDVEGMPMVFSMGVSEQEANGEEKTEFSINMVVGTAEDSTLFAIDGQYNKDATGKTLFDVKVTFTQTGLNANFSIGYDGQTEDNGDVKGRVSLAFNVEEGEAVTEGQAGFDLSYASVEIDPALIANVKAQPQVAIDALTPEVMESLQYELMGVASNAMGNLMSAPGVMDIFMMFAPSDESAPMDYEAADAEGTDSLPMAG